MDRISMSLTKQAPVLGAGAAKQVIIDDGKGNLQYCRMNKTINFLILHREGGPAIDYANSYKAHYKDGLLHGTVEFAGRVCSTWKNGVRVE